MSKKYKILYQKDGKIKTKFIQTDDLDNEILPSNIIEIKRVNFDFLFSNNTIKEKDLKNCLYELNLMLNSKILIDDALDILIKNEKKKNLKKFLIALKETFTNTHEIHSSLDKFKINPLVKSFFKITQQTGDPISNITALTQILSENYDVKREFKKSITYPAILLVTFFLALVGIFKFVVPNFESIFLKSSVEIPLATQLLLSTKSIFGDNLHFIIIGLLLIFFAFIILYKRVYLFKAFIDRVLVNNLFIISDIYKSKVLYNYFISMEILLKNKHDFLESITKSKVLLNNQYLLDKITQIETLLKKGKSVKVAFESTNIFDDVTLNLINTGEVTSSLEVVVGEIKNIFKRKFSDKLKLFSLLIEPLFFIIIMSLIVWIILAIFVPLWSMSDMLK